MTIDATLSRDGTYVGTLTGDERSCRLQATTDTRTRMLFERALHDGTPQYTDHRHGTASTIVRRTLHPGEPGFSLALVHHLRRSGLNVQIHHPELDAEIRSLLAHADGDRAAAVRLLRELPEMTYLERTFLLKKLRDTSSRAVRSSRPSANPSDPS